jgi:WhiB family redox-sensing transcriptional regulator
MPDHVGNRHYNRPNPSAFLFGQKWVHEPWRQKAKCASLNVDPAVFFPENAPGVNTNGMVAEARTICAGCPVKYDCLEFAMRDEQVWVGIWGGLTPRERRKLRSKWKIARLTIPQGIELLRHPPRAAKVR